MTDKSINASDRLEKPITPTFGAVFAPHNSSYPWPGCHDPSLRPKNEGMLGIIPQDTTKTWVSPAECWDHDPVTGQERING